MDIQKDFGLEEEQSQTYTDDVVPIATSQSDLQQLVDRVDRASRKYGLKSNVDKTKITATQVIVNNITINGTPQEKVETFTYLGSLFAQEAECDTSLVR